VSRIAVRVSFDDHVALLGAFLDRRREIVESIESRLLNVQGKELSRDRNRDRFDQLLNACFFSGPGLSPDLLRLKGQLAAAHLADGFEPVPIGPYSQQLDPLELILRAYHHWEHHRWPGKAGRSTYAGTIYVVFMLRQFEHLSLRICDDGPARASEHLHQAQMLLDRLNAPAPPGVFVRDVRWLMQTAQGTLTRHLLPYFHVAQQIADAFHGDSGLVLHAAGARLAGGHLRSQLQYRCWDTALAIDDAEVQAITRNSNSMDAALLVWDLVPLLDAYRDAQAAQNTEARLELADAILQGLSADPELLVTRLDLLTPYTMIEDLFIERDVEGRPQYSALGRRHLDLLERYRERISELAEPLTQDASSFDPAGHAYSPFGVAYGFCADILSNMALDALVAQPTHGLSLEDMFVSRGGGDAKLARAGGWAALPAREGEREHFQHSIEWAGQMFARLMRALRARSIHGSRPNASDVRDAAIHFVPAAALAGDLPSHAASAEEHCVTSDLTRAFGTAATGFPRSQILRDRSEARFLGSAETDGKWFGVSKTLLTRCLGLGRNALVPDAPPAVIDTLRLTCPGLMLGEP
jgi:hypothetical protein